MQVLALLALLATLQQSSAPPAAIRISGDAVCEVWAVEMGWDLRLMIDGHGLQLYPLCRSGQEMVERARNGAWR